MTLPGTYSSQNDAVELSTMHEVHLDALREGRGTRERKEQREGEKRREGREKSQEGEEGRR